MSIVVKNVSKIYGTQKALNDVSFELVPGEIVGFLGPNGAGKSTMMKILTGFIPPSLGEIYIDEINIAEDPIAIKKKIGYLPENNPLYLDLYVKEYLSFIAGLHQIKNKKERVAELIEMLGLTIEQHKKIGALSKGYKQRVGLAQAMIHDPEILILDEPTTGLDPNQLEEIRGLIKQMGKDKTIMLSTHIMQEVEAICDTIIIINQGNIVAHNATKKITVSTQKNILLSVVFDKKIDRKALAKIKGVSNIKERENNSFFLEVDKKEVRNEIFKLAMEKDITILSLQEEKESLENVFRNLTKEKKAAL